jgi:hypothetical protein
MEEAPGFPEAYIGGCETLTVDEKKRLIDGGIQKKDWS